MTNKDAGGDRELAEQAHTPGPYMAGEMTMTKAAWADLRGTGLHTIVQRGPDVLAIVFTDDDHDEDAQARLFAASPDLLKAAKRALAVLRAQGEAALPKNALGALDAAIAKAEGRK